MVTKKIITMLIALLMMGSVFTACGSKEEVATETTEQITVVETTEQTTGANADSDDASTITEDEAIALVKEKKGAGFSYVSDGTVEKNGAQYYSIRMMSNASGTNSTLDIYYVKVDGSEVIDANGDPVETTDASYVGEYFVSNETDVTMKISEDGTFEMTTVDDDFKNVISGVYSIGVAASADVTKLVINPQKSVSEVDGETTEEDMTGIEPGTANIEGDKLTLVLDGAETVFTKK